MKKRGKRKKTTKRKTKEKIIKTIWNLCAYFISFGFANAASQQLPQGHRCPGGGGVWKEECGRNILGNVLCRVLSFLRDFPPRFYFFRYPLDGICSAHRYIRYVHIYILISICICKPEWEVVFIFDLAKRFHAFLERKLKQFECTIARWHEVVLAFSAWCDFTHDKKRTKS